MVGTCKSLKEAFKETEDALSQLLWRKYFINALSIVIRVENTTVMCSSASKNSEREPLFQ